MPDITKKQLLAAALLGILIAGSDLAIAAPGVTGAGDEATLAAKHDALIERLARAERAGTMSPAEAARHRRALDTMIASAKRDIARPPHFISAAENATYRRTIAGVENALAQPGAADPNQASWGLIVTYRPGDEQARRRIIAHTRAAGFSLGYDLPRMSRMTINGRGDRQSASAIAAYRKIPGVVSVDREQSADIQALPSR